jgi:hypothetical protein
MLLGFATCAQTLDSPARLVFRLVAGDLHRDRFGDAGAVQIADRGPTHVGRDPAATTGCSAGLVPARAEALNACPPPRQNTNGLMTSFCSSASWRAHSVSTAAFNEHTLMIFLVDLPFEQLAKRGAGHAVALCVLHGCNLAQIESRESLKHMNPDPSPIEINRHLLLALGILLVGSAVVLTFL